MLKIDTSFVRPLLGLTGLLAFAVSSVSAATLVHWRFEEYTAGSSVPASATGGDPAFADTVLDSSGNGNHLRTWADFSAPTFSSNVPFSTVPQTGAANGLSLGTVPNQDLYTEGKPINTQTFNEWTIEASFLTNDPAAYRAILGKDGNPIGGPSPVFLKTLFHNGGHLELGLVDGSATFRTVESLAPLANGEWYSVAATASATEMSLWLKGPGDSGYVLQGTTAISGAFFNDFADFDRTWSVGRGMWNGNIADWFDGNIDEVRISDTVLAPGDFMAVPEPSTYALLGGLGALAFVVLRRRRFKS